MLFLFRNMTVDHIIPKSKGGQDNEENLQLLCGACNSDKGDRPMEYLLAKLKERGTINLCIHEKGGLMMNKIDGLNDEQRGAFDNLLKSLLDAQEEFERGIQAAQSNPDADWADLRRNRAYAFESLVEQLEFLVEKEELYLKLAELMFGDDDQTPPIGGMA